MSDPGACFVRNVIRFGALLAILSLVLTPEETLKSYLCTLVDNWFGRLQQTQACFDLMDRCPFPVSVRIVVSGVATAFVVLWRRSAPSTERRSYRESGTHRGDGGGCDDASDNKHSKTSNAGGPPPPPSPSPPAPTRKRSVVLGRRGRPAVRGSGSTTTTTAGQMINGDMNMNVSNSVMNYNARDPWRVADVESDFEPLEETNEALSARHPTT